MTHQGSTAGLGGCFILTQRTNRGTLVIPEEMGKYASSDGGPSLLVVSVCHNTQTEHVCTEEDQEERTERAQTLESDGGLKKKQSVSR